MKCSVIAVFIGFFALSSCSSSDVTPVNSVTTTTIDPRMSIANEVEQFVQSYLAQATASRPDLISKVPKNDLIVCVNNAVQQIARSAAGSTVRSTAEELAAWIARSRSAALQSAQAGIEGPIAACSR
jgi:hypothetical protein